MSMARSEKDFEFIERLSRDGTSRRSSEALETLLRHAFENVPHYREALASRGVITAGSLHAEDLALFPALGREVVRDGVETGSLLARGVPQRRRVVTNTTGSTGIPLRLYGDTRSRLPRRQGWRLLNRWAGIQRGDECVSMLVPRPRPSWSPYQPLRSLRKRIFFRQPSDLLSIYMLHAEDVPGIVNVLASKAGPYHIYGVSSAIHLIAERALATGLHLSRAPRAAIGTGDGFTIQQRATASAFLGCPAFSRFGSYEVGGGVAQTCPDNPRVHHVISELVIVEVVDHALRPVAPGERGRMLLTDLTNYVMPFIRYDIGDMATAAGECTCGRPWPVLGEIIGRSADRILLEDGESRPAFELEVTLFYYHAKLARRIMEYQFVQHGPGEIEMRFVPRAPIQSGDIEDLRVALVQTLRDKARVAVVPVEQIERAESGKRRLVVQGHGG